MLRQSAIGLYTIGPALKPYQKTHKGSEKMDQAIQLKQKSKETKNFKRRWQKFGSGKASRFETEQSTNPHRSTGEKSFGSIMEFSRITCTDQLQ